RAAVPSSDELLAVQRGDVAAGVAFEIRRVAHGAGILIRLGAARGLRRGEDTFPDGARGTGAGLSAFQLPSPVHSCRREEQRRDGRCSSAPSASSASSTRFVLQNSNCALTLKSRASMMRCGVRHTANDAFSCMIGLAFVTL